MSTKKSLLIHASVFRKAAEKMLAAAEDYEAMAKLFPDEGGPAVQHAELDGPTFVPTDEKANFLAAYLGRNGWQQGRYPRIAVKPVYRLKVTIERWGSEV